MRRQVRQPWAVDSKALPLPTASRAELVSLEGWAPKAMTGRPPPLGGLSSAGWAPSAGGQGKTATRAQGGGGGGARNGAGGGGGAGGCGGTGGEPGGGGGASVALAIVGSKVKLTTSKLTSGAGGPGGDGAAGQLGQPPGGGGNGATVAVGFDGCTGGQGGTGAQGGAGAGGAGGIAPAVLTKGGVSFIKDDASTLEVP